MAQIAMSLAKSAWASCRGAGAQARRLKLRGWTVTCVGFPVARDSGTGGLTGIHPTKQGLLYISVHSNHFFQAMCEMVGLGELAHDPRYDSMRKRAAASSMRSIALSGRNRSEM